MPTVLAAYNWPKGSDRHARLARFVDYLLSRLDQLHAPGFHPAWRDVNVAAQVPGLRRFTPAQEWIERNRVNIRQRAAAGAPQR